MPDLHKDPLALRALATSLRSMHPSEHDLQQAGAALTAIAYELEPTVATATPSRAAIEIHVQPGASPEDVVPAILAAHPAGEEHTS
jgi:hypothetical protein